MWVHKVRQPVLIITAAFAGNIAVAKDISCKGTMSDVVNDPRMAFPYAVVYDIENHRTCMLDLIGGRPAMIHCAGSAMQGRPVRSRDLKGDKTTKLTSSISVIGV